MSHRDDSDRLWHQLRRVFRLPASRARLDAELDDELRFHLEGRIEELMQREGLDRRGTLHRRGRDARCLSRGGPRHASSPSHRER